MISVVIATHELERALVHTLAALVPGALAGVVREVIVADAGSQRRHGQGRRHRRLPFHGAARRCARRAAGRCRRNGARGLAVVSSARQRAGGGLDRGGGALHPRRRQLSSTRRTAAVLRRRRGSSGLAEAIALATAALGAPAEAAAGIADRQGVVPQPRRPRRRNARAGSGAHPQARPAKDCGARRRHDLARTIGASPRGPAIFLDQAARPVGEHFVRCGPISARGPVDRAVASRDVASAPSRGPLGLGSAALMPSLVASEVAAAAGAEALAEREAAVAPVAEEGVDAPRHLQSDLARIGRNGIFITACLRFPLRLVCLRHFLSRHRCAPGSCLIVRGLGLRIFLLQLFPACAGSSSP